MAMYTFSILKGQSKPQRSVEADDDAAAYRKIAELLKREGAKLVSGSIVMTKAERRDVPDPPPFLKAA